MVALNYEVKHIRKNEYSRPGFKLLKVQAVVDHFTANPGADAEDHHKYFDETIIRIKRYAGAHIFVDRYKALELIPLDEGAYHANDGGTDRQRLSALKVADPRYPTPRGEGNANLLTIGIEMCLESDGTIHPDTIKRTALVHQMLQKRFPQLKDTYNRFVRHYDVTGKNCPAPMVKDPSLYKYLLDMTDGKIEINPKEVIQVAEKKSDIKGHWAEESIEKAIAAKVMVGYPDGSFKPDQPVTRAELAHILMNK